MVFWGGFFGFFFGFFFGAWTDAGLKWELCVDPEFESKWFSDCEVLEAGPWGQRLRLFYHTFYGEG